MALREAWQHLWPMGGVLSASLAIAWATEVAAFFLSRGLAFALLALLQVLPEFAVEAVTTYEGALNPERLHLVTANFTGANRLIVGLFLPMVFFIAAHRARSQGKKLSYVELPKESSIEVLALAIATLYSFSFVFRASIHLADAAILVALYATYLVMTYRLPPSDDGHEELPLVPRTIRRQSIPKQKWLIFVFFLLGGLLLFSSVHPFYENTIELGILLGISSYFLFQWIAPLLSEFPELVTIVYWGRTGRAQHGLTNAISSKINQWTLLIAMVPMVYAYGTWTLGSLRPHMEFDSSQQLEILLTAAQGLFAVAALLNLRFHAWEAWTLLLLWSIQLLDPLIDPLLPTSIPYVFEPTLGEYPHYIREWTTAAYLILTIVVVLLPRRRWQALKGFREVVAEHVLRTTRRKAATAAKRTK